MKYDEQTHLTEMPIRTLYHIKFLCAQSCFIRAINSSLEGNKEYLLHYMKASKRQKIHDINAVCQTLESY